jgi:hypothetical protein
MPYERVYIPELGKWKIIGELTGEEALALSATIPAGMTQWGWNAQSGTFAYGTSLESRLVVYSAPPETVSGLLVNRPDTYRPDMTITTTYPEITGSAIGADQGAMLALGISILIGLPLLLSNRRRRNYGKVKSSRKKKSKTLFRAKK